VFILLGIIIIDDEVLVRVGLKSLVEWEKYGYQIIGEASNGEEGIKLIKERKADIVITDIKMPIKDGLEMIKEFQENDFAPKFIVLSSFDEFHLVKKAMKLGAKDYLIKLELDKNILLETLTPIKNMINKEKEKKKNEDIINHTVNNKNNMKKEFFKKLIGKLINDNKKINLILKEFDISLSEDNLFCMVIQINNLDYLNKFNKGDMQLFEFSIMNIVEEIIDDFFEAYAFMNKWGEIVVIFSLNDIVANNYVENINEMTAILNRMLKQYFSVNITVSISKPHNGFNNLNATYQECCEGQEHSFQYQSGKAIFYKDVLNYQKHFNEGLNLRPFTADLIEVLDIMDYQEIEKIFNDLIRKVSTSNLSRSQAYDLCFEIIYIIKDKLNNELSTEILAEDKDFYKCIETLNNIKEVLDWLQYIKDRIYLVINNHVDDEKSFIITKAKKYIKDHFSEEFNLTDLADELNISAGYLSTLFKEIVGIGFSEYITKLKIDKAKDLLSNSNIKIYKISEMIGYNNPYYFSRVFKKYIGKSPSEYR